MPPLKLGVLTQYFDKSDTFEDLSFFRQLTVAGKRIGVDVYIFTPDNTDETNRRIYAHYYDGRKWGQKWIAYPDLFLDRSRFHSAIRYRAAFEFRKRNPQLMYLNSPLADKWKVYQQLERKPAIKPYLPATALYRNFNDLRKELSNKRIVFLKPIKGTGGRGILRIEKLFNGIYSVQGRMPNRTIIPDRQVNLTQLRMIVKTKKPEYRYIIQQGIDLRLKDGTVHDYRLLIQKNGGGKWEVTGCVGRVGPSGSITSNLHGGGRAVPMMKLLQMWFGSEEKAESVAENIHGFSYLLAEILETSYGRLCELAFDIAVDHDGRIWLLEVNTKPAREVFARIGDRSAYLKAIIRPLEYAKWIYRNKTGDISL